MNEWVYEELYMNLWFEFVWRNEMENVNEIIFAVMNEPQLNHCTHSMVINHLFIYSFLCFSINSNQRQFWKQSNYNYAYTLRWTFAISACEMWNTHAFSSAGTFIKLVWICLNVCFAHIPNGRQCIVLLMYPNQQISNQIIFMPLHVSCMRNAAEHSSIKRKAMGFTHSIYALINLYFCSRQFHSLYFLHSLIFVWSQEIDD